LDTLLQFAGYVLHIDKFFGTFVAQYGAWIYLVLFAIVFCETGLVVLPFLPGDTLLFVGGAFCATHALSLPVLIGLLLIAAVLGNTVNFHIGRFIGPKVFERDGRFIDRRALRKTHDFYERHGGKTIVLARFVPVVRTFAPFVAGVGAMSVVKFQIYNVLGAALWVAGLVMAGYFFGNLPFVRQYLNVIVLVGVAAAVVPVAFGALYKLTQRKSAQS
jgi:membrane-associated protein